MASFSKKLGLFVRCYFHSQTAQLLSYVPGDLIGADIVIGIDQNKIKHSLTNFSIPLRSETSQSQMNGFEKVSH